MDLIKRVQTKDHIADLLRKEILLNHLKDGEELIQEVVSNQLGVSRMPVREAFQILELEGFLKRLPNRHVIVKGITKQGIHEIFSFICDIQIGFIKNVIHTKEEYYEHFQKVYNEYKCNSMNEIKLHRFFSEEVENYYIQQLHKKLLDIYVFFVLEDLELSGAEEIQIWDDVAEAIRTKDEEKLSELFKHYYLCLTNKMVEKVL